jgi:acyl dehydratase
MSDVTANAQGLDLQKLTGNRLGPYCSFNPVSRVQIWQWCSAMGDRNPLYLDNEYRSKAGFKAAVAPPAMMQMWSMRDVNMQYAPGSTDAPPYQALDTLAEAGFPGNVAVSYDITFHRLLLEGDRAHHYTTVVAISELKRTALGEGYFVTERVEYLDQQQALFAEALITYFQYKPAEKQDTAEQPASSPAVAGATNAWQTDYSDIDFDQLSEGQAIPELVIPITHKLIVSGAVATQDFIDVHHNAPAAKAAAMPDIFMNILTTSGLCARYLSDWAGPASRLKRIKFKLMAPNVPGDTMIMQGRIRKLEQADAEHCVTVDFAGKNGLGFHVTGTATLALNQTDTTLR